MPPGLPPLHLSLPWPWKVAALLAYSHPHGHGFGVSLPHVAAPFAVLALYLVAAYTPPILLARSQHPALCAHVLVVLVAATLYAYGAVLLLTIEPAVAPLAALLGALHTLHAVVRTLAVGIYATPDLVPNQDVLAGGGTLASGALLTAAWFTLPRPTAAPEHVLLLSLAPELTGTAMWVLARMALPFLP